MNIRLKAAPQEKNALPKSYLLAIVQAVFTIFEKPPEKNALPKSYLLAIVQAVFTTF
jgi:hypothetical protein